MDAAEDLAIMVLIRQLVRLPGVARVEAVRANPDGSITGMTRLSLASGEVEICDDLAMTPEVVSTCFDGGTVRSCAAVPVTTARGLWGTAVLCSEQAQFPRSCLDPAIGLVEIASVAVGSAQRCAELDASRSRLMAEVDDAFMRIERELHDGVGQHLTATGMEVRAARDALPADDRARATLVSLGEQLVEMSAEVRELSGRTFPAILSDGGIGPALRSLSRHATLPVELDLAPLGRYPALLEVTVYQVLANVVAHAVNARASHVSAEMADQNGHLRLIAAHDGVDLGADPEVVTPVVRDRVDALGASLEVGTTLSGGATAVADFPIRAGADGERSNHQQ
jgi:signal transduction histidine kinase